MLLLGMHRVECPKIPEQDIPLAGVLEQLEDAAFARLRQSKLRGLGSGF